MAIGRTFEEAIQKGLRMIGQGMHGFVENKDLVIPDIDKAMEEGWSTASPTVRARGFGAGMGLPNMKRNADEMDIQTTLGVGTTVTMVIYIGGDGK